MDPTGQTPASCVGLATLLCEETGLGDAPASEQGCGHAGPHIPFYREISMKPTKQPSQGHGAGGLRVRPT